MLTRLPRGSVVSVSNLMPKVDRGSAAFTGRTEPTVSVVFSPQQTIYLQLRDGARRLLGGDYGRAWRLPDAVVRADRCGVLRTLAAGGRGTIPEAMVPVVAARDVSAAEQFAAILDYPVDVFQHQARASGSPVWRNAADRPQLWLRSYAAVCRVAWQYLQPRWDQTRSVLDRSAEQVGVATVRGGLDSVLDSLSPRIHFGAGLLQLDAEDPAPVGSRRLVLVPSIAREDSYFFVDVDDATVDPEDDVLSVAYPVRSISDRDATPPDADPADLVLGATRAALLRLLAGPRTVGVIAAALQISPSSASRHCDQLESAGLILRQRAGQTVEITRTAAGTRLLEALSSH